MSNNNDIPEQFLIVKRGLYYRPEAAGYTGLKVDAGRYSLSNVAAYFPNRESPNQDGMAYILEAEAPDYSPSCPWDVRMKREAFLKGLAQSADLLTAAEARVAKLEAALRWYGELLCENGDGTNFEGCGKMGEEHCTGCKAIAALKDTDT